MIIGAYLDHAAPDHPAGAEWTIQDTFAWLARRKHGCRIVSTNGYTQAMVDGVRVYCRPSEDEVAQHFEECDVMLTQLGATAYAQVLALRHQTPLVQYVHSAHQIDDLGVMPSCSALVVFNAQHVADACDWWPGASMVLHPAVDAERVRVEKPGACTTLVNLSNAKGGATLWRLAQALEQVPFLGVQGAYDHQAITPRGLALHSELESETGLPANLQVLGALRDIRSALAFTRTLLVLSHTETYGRIAAEAAVSGIPTICVDTPGLRECLGDAAQYVERDDARGLERLIRESYTPAWAEWNSSAMWQATENAARQELELRRFERHLRRIKKEQPEMIL